MKFIIIAFAVIFTFSSCKIRQSTTAKMTSNDPGQIKAFPIDGIGDSITIHINGFNEQTPTDGPDFSVRRFNPINNLADRSVGIYDGYHPKNFIEYQQIAKFTGWINGKNVMFVLKEKPDHTYLAIGEYPVQPRNEQSKTSATEVLQVLILASDGKWIKEVLSQKYFITFWYSHWRAMPIYSSYSAHTPNWRCNGRLVGPCLCFANGFRLGAADLGC